MNASTTSEIQVSGDRRSIDGVEFATECDGSTICQGLLGSGGQIDGVVVTDEGVVVKKESCQGASTSDDVITFGQNNYCVCVFSSSTTHINGVIACTCLNSEGGVVRASIDVDDIVTPVAVNFEVATSKCCVIEVDGVITITTTDGHVSVSSSALIQGDFVVTFVAVDQ